MSLRTSLTMAVWCVLAGVAHGQVEFTVGGRTVEVHGFASQGFLHSGANNYLTLKTSEGSFAATDGGINASVRLTDRLRIGAQAYIRNMGDLGGGHPVLDWGFADYRVKDWFGLRAGRVKTVLGLFNDTQDNEFLHTWALLPQSIYPLDLRGSTIAHDGADAYGAIPLKRLGSLEYTVYGGQRVFDRYGGYPYSLHTVFTIPGSEFNLLSESGRVMGADVRWTTPLPGLTVGASHANYTYANHGEGDPGNPYEGFSSARSVKNYTHAFYFDYAVNRFRLYGEFQKIWEDNHILVGSPRNLIYILDYYKSQLPWYAAVSYRLNRRLEVGTYHAQFQATTSDLTSPHSTRMTDQAVTARVDVNSHWDVKLEGHFIRGVPIGLNLRGFYASVNPTGYRNATNLLVVRTGFVF